MRSILRLLYFFLTTWRQAWKAWIKFNLSATKQSKSFLISRFVLANLFLMEIILRFFLRNFLQTGKNYWKCKFITDFNFGLQSEFVLHLSLCTNNHRWCSVKIGVIKNFTKLTGKHMYQCLFFNEVAGWDSGTGSFLWILWNF